MPFQLKLRIVGICLITQRNQVTHLLIPESNAGHDGHAGHDSHDHAQIDRHDAFLFFGSTELSPIDPVPAAISLERCVLRITDESPVGGSPQAPTIPSTIFDLGTVVGPTTTLPAAFFDPASLPSALRARVELNLNGVAAAENRVDFQFEDTNQRQVGTPVPTDTLALWFESIHDGKLKIEIDRFDDAGAKQTIEVLPPEPVNGQVFLDILHVPRVELPPAPPIEAQNNQLVDHFHLYYDLCGFTGTRLLPRIVNLPSDEQSTRTVRCPPAQII